MRIYSGNTIDAQGVTTWHYSDVVDCLPPTIREFHVHEGVENLDGLRDAIADVEATGQCISWQVGTEAYFTVQP